MRLHDLRHTTASLLLAQGVHPRVVMETLGQSQIPLTLDTYSHVLPSLQEEAARQMDEAIGCQTDAADQTGADNPQKSEGKVVSQPFVSWNQIAAWLKQVDGFRGCS